MKANENTGSEGPSVTYTRVLIEVMHSPLRPCARESFFLFHELEAN